jgi:hypothetical protein
MPAQRLGGLTFYTMHLILLLLAMVPYKAFQNSIENASNDVVPQDVKYQYDADQTSFRSAECCRMVVSAKTAKTT